uniref:Uncharacterized protein n=1 Tax=Populus trichocarpa TaxID=3694 RepID=A0A2K2AJW7_POPTR
MHLKHKMQAPHVKIGMKVKTKNILVQLGNNYHLKPLPVPQPQYKTLLASFLYFSDLLLFLPHFSLHTK